MSAPPACRDDAARIRELGQIVDRASAQSAGPIVREARDRAAAAWAAARDAARAAAWAAAGAAAGAAAWAVLQPTVAVLQLSAIELYRQMALVGREDVSRSGT